jgi:protein TonB
MRPLNRAEWFTEKDYPRDAKRRGAQGLVKVLLHVAPSGKPTSCEVEQSSGDATLDRTTCTLLMKRARFLPSIDDKGEPVEGNFTAAAKWQIP